MIINVPDMSCNHCKMKIEKSLGELSGIENVNINLDSKSVEVTGDIKKEAVIKKIEEAGYTVED